MFCKFLTRLALLLAAFSITPSRLCAETHLAGPTLILKNAQESGMFAVFASVMGVLDFYEKGDYTGIHVDFDTGLYLDSAQGPNWWEYYFEPINIGAPTPRKYIFSIVDCIQLAWSGFQLPRSRAYQLIQRYVHTKFEIQAEIDAYVRDHFANHFVIGVHHRGTDKVFEYAIVDYDKTANAVNSVIASLSDEQRAAVRIYVATDDQHFLTYLASLFPATVIYNDFVRSSDGTPLHAGNLMYKSNYQKGKEAVIDCLLLSRCNYMVRPASSSLSYASTFFNPYIPVIALSN